MNKIWRRLYIRFRMHWRMFKLLFVHVPEPEDAKSEEEMLAEIKKKLGMD